MIVVKIPNNNIAEREYIIDFIFKKLLGILHKVEVITDENKYEIILENGRRLIFKDYFFSKYPIDKDYLSSSNIPGEISFGSNKYTIEDSIPIIFGSNELIVKGDSIISGIDIFASSFFMLTRWEEYVLKNRDEYDRFPAKESLAYKNNFLHRPVVNEYVEMLWKMLVALEYNGNRKRKTFEIVPSHDIDFLTRGFKRRVYDLIKDKNPKALLDFKNILSIKNDPYNLFDFFMTQSEKIGVKSRFYFMSDNKNLYGTRFYLNKNFFKTTINKIIERDHIIGFHPGFNTYKNKELWDEEKKRLEEVTEVKIEEGRQHFLKVDIPDTFDLWERAGMKLDSTLGYSAKEGFRCGTGDRFQIFNFIRREKLELEELPLVIMDGTIFSNYKDEKERLKVIQQYLDVGKRYSMKISILFHNSFVDYSKKEFYSNLFIK